MRQKHYWNCFAFNQSYLNKGKITSAVLLLRGKILNTWFYMGGSGLDQTDDFQKFCGSGLDRIQLLRIRIGLGLKNLTVRSSLVRTSQNRSEKCQKFEKNSTKKWWDFLKNFVKCSNFKVSVSGFLMKCRSWSFNQVSVLTVTVSNTSLESWSTHVKSFTFVLPHEAKILLELFC